MIYVFGTHPVKDFDTWKPFFDNDQPRAIQEDIHVVKLFRSVEDPNVVSMLFTAPSVEKAQTFFSDPILGKLMQEAGVLAPPTVQFLNEA